MSGPDTVKGDIEARERWVNRLVCTLFVVFALGIASDGWRQDLPPMFVMGLLMAAFGVWLLHLYERASRAQLTIRSDGCIEISSPGLLRHSLVVPAGGFSLIRTDKVDRNDLPHESSLTLLARRNYILVKFAQPREIPGARWTNYLLATRLQSDYRFIPPPLPGRTISALVFAVPTIDAGLTGPIKP